MGFEPALLKIVALAGVATYGLTSAVKPALKKYTADSWQRLAVRFAALIIGAGFGFAIQHDATGALCGFSGGALSCVIVAAIKSRIGKRA